MTDMIIDFGVEDMMSSCWGDEAMIADTRTNTVPSVVNKTNKLTWGIPLERVVEIPEDGESLMEYMKFCSNKMEILAKEREKFKDFFYKNTPGARRSKADSVYASGFPLDSAALAI